jgi:hypothetical protein
MVRQINPSTLQKVPVLHACGNDGRAGATLPFDARCVTGFVRSLPPSHVLRANAHCRVAWRTLRTCQTKCLTF